MRLFSVGRPIKDPTNIRRVPLKSVRGEVKCRQLHPGGIYIMVETLLYNIVSPAKLTLESLLEFLFCKNSTAATWRYVHVPRLCVGLFFVFQ